MHIIIFDNKKTKKNGKQEIYYAIQNRFFSHKKDLLSSLIISLISQMNYEINKNHINLVSLEEHKMKQHNRSQLVAEKKLIKTLPKIKINEI